METVTSADPIYLVVLSGDPERAHSFVRETYPTNPTVVLEKAQLMAGGWQTRLRTLRQLRGEALVLFTESLELMWEARLKLAVGFAHRCRLTIFADEARRCRVYTRLGVVLRTPEFVLSGILDLFTLAGAEVGQRVLTRWLTAPLLRRSTEDYELDLIHLYPFPFQPLKPGGELSYLRGTLSGLREASVSTEVLSGCPMPITDFPVHLIPNHRRLYLCKESLAVSYNLRFVLGVRKAIAGRRPRVIYQRHGGFVLSGAILARLLRVPLALEYQGSVHWWAKTWVPTRFLGLLQRVEDLSLEAASIVVVVSDALRTELVAKGIHPERIIVNPAAVDPERFQSSPRRNQTREDFGFVEGNVVVGFVGSFSHWHGIDVLERAILHLLARPDRSATLSKLRFLLVGDGVLRRSMERRLDEGGASKLTVFTGTVPADRVPDFLDAADILVAPNVPMPGKAFFGSPSKLFEYMAMGKAIVASDLDQLADVLEHGETAWLVPPTDDRGLADAIEHLASSPELRLRLGRNAHAAALERHTWRQNALRLIKAVGRVEEGRMRSIPSPGTDSS